MTKKGSKKAEYIYKHRYKILLVVTLVVFGVVLFLYYRGVKNPDSFNVSEISKQTSNISVSSYSLMQADTLLVAVKNEPKEITGKLGNLHMRFFRNENNKDWISITGIPIDKNPGDYKLVINIPDKTSFEKNITISKRIFPLTKLAITPKLLSEGYTAKKIINTIASTEKKALDEVLNVTGPMAYFKKPFLYPLSKVTVVGRFGDIRTTSNYKIQHLGVDLKADTGTFVYSVNDGKVVFVKNLPDYGNIIIIDHGLGIYSLYLHLSDFKVITGQMVKRGDLIGLSGDTGYAIAPHLHFSIKVRGAALDPLKFIQTTQTEW